MGWGARVSDFFTKNPNQKNNFLFFGRRGGGGGDRVSELKRAPASKRAK